ncbi:sensory box protein, partial [Vibrio parahaemolyticus V-223/04]
RLTCANVCSSKSHREVRG